MSFIISLLSAVLASVETVCRGRLVAELDFCALVQPFCLAIVSPALPSCNRGGIGDGSGPYRMEPWVE